MKLFGWRKNKKGVALTYAVMVLLLLSTVIVAITALASGSYTSAVESIAEDQSYYFAKSIGLAVKQQFLDGYSINKVITSLDEQIAGGKTADPVVEGTYSLEDKKNHSDLINGTISIRYAQDEMYYGGARTTKTFKVGSTTYSYNPYFLEVRVACMWQGSLAVVTSVFSCEEDINSDAAENVLKAFSKYDVILTSTKSQSFGFSDSASGSSSLNVYVYGEEGTTNDPFLLDCDMKGQLTTSGDTKILGYNFTVDAPGWLRTISTGLTCYGDLTLKYVEVQGSKGIHSSGSVTMDEGSFVKNDIFARGNVNLKSKRYNSQQNGFSNYSSLQAKYTIKQDVAYTARNVYSQGSINVDPRISVSGNLVARKDVKITGYTLPSNHPRNPNGLPMLDQGYYNGQLTYYYDGGGNYIGGNVIADGDVTITYGAYVAGDVIANGNITIANGAFVAGNVISYAGNVEVSNSACVGGSVWAQKKLSVFADITEGADGYNQKSIIYYNVCSWNFADAYGCTVPGIGITQAGAEHYCGSFETRDRKFTSRIVGNLTVFDQSVTNFGAIWIWGNVRLEKGRATFEMTNETNYAGNASTFMKGLYQHKDLWSGDYNNPWLNLHGSWIGSIVCQSDTSFYDAFIYNGRLVNNFESNPALKGRCLGVANMDVYANYNIYAKHWFQTSYFIDESAAPLPSVIWTTVRDYLNSAVVPTNYTIYRGNNQINISFEKQEAYNGWAANTSNETATSKTYRNAFGGSIAYSVIMPGNVTIKIGQNTKPQMDSSFVIYGRNAVYAKIHACVDYFELSGNSNISYTAGYAAQNVNDFAKIYVRANNFVLTASSTPEAKIGMSELHIEGSATIYGRAYTVYHYKGSYTGDNFTMGSAAKILKHFWSNGSGEIRLQGTFGKVELKNKDSVLIPVGELSFTEALLLNGRYNNKNKKKVSVSGDMRIGNYSSTADGSALYVNYVSGNLTVIGSQAGTPLTIGKYGSVEPTVNGELYTENINLSLNSGCKLKSVYGSEVTISGATINGRCVATGTLQVNSGTLSDLVKGKTVKILGGTLKGNSSTKIDAGTFVQSNGTISNYDLYVSGGDPTGGKAFTVTNGTMTGVRINIPNGGASIGGGSALKYTGVKGVAKTASTITGHYEGGFSVTSGNLTIGSDGDSGSTYTVGSGITINSSWVDDDRYYAFYANGTLTWKGKAIPYTQDKPSRAAAIAMTSKGNMTIGSSTNVIQGYFGDICSLNGSVVAYVRSVEAVSAKTTATIHATALCGGDSFSGWYGFKSGGNATISGGGTFKGVFEVGGTLTISDTINAEARIKCAKIVGLEKITTKKSATTSNYGAKVSLYLTGYKSSETFELKTSLVKNRSTAAGTDADTGSITVNPGNLKYSSSVKVEGGVWVDGTFTYNGSTENLISLGGIRCSNTNVNIAKEFKGSIDLPNVTSITLNANVSGQLRAPNVTSVSLNYNVDGVAEFPKVTSFTIKSGISIGGIVIKSDGTVTNNGTVTGVKDNNGNLTLGGVECGKYAGSGTIGGGNLVIKGTSECTIAGEVKANIWSKAPLKITASKIGASGTYVYSEKSITATGTTFNSGMSYIRTSGGNMTFTNCPNLPSVQNSSGYIKFSNDKDHKGKIKEVISTGKNILFGASDSTNYITVTGSVDWAGNYKTTDGIWAVDGYRTNDKAVVEIKGFVNCYGTGDYYHAFKVGNNLNLQNTGEVKLVGGTSVGGNLFINDEGQSVKKVTWESGASVAGYAFVYGTKTGNLKTINMKGSVGQDLLVNNFDVACVYGTVSGELYGNACNDVTLKSGGTIGSARMQLYGGRFYSYGTINGNVNAYNSHIWVKEGTINGNVTSASNTASTYWCELGQKGKTVTVKGNINVRGILIDNTHNYGMIYCLGTYLGDIGKEWNDCGQIHFSPENGWAWIFSPTNKDQNQMNSYLNIEGWLLISNRDDSHKIVFNNEVYCHALNVNTNTFDTIGNAGDYIPSAFGRTSGTYRENCTNGQLAGSLDKSSTNRHLVVFNKPVYVLEGTDSKGCCHVANAEFAKGSMLVTDGQTCLSYCILYSQGFSADDSDHNWHQGNNVAYYDSNGNQDGSMFVHGLTTNGNANFFYKTDTHSNVSVYHGHTYMNGGCKFNGVSGSTSTGTTGSKLTKLFYFGNGLSMYGSGTGIYSRPPVVEKTPSARTIIWIPNGSLTVGPGTYIGKNVTKAQVTSSSTVNLDAKKNSSNPGVFVSNGSAWFYGTCTLDIYAKTQIVVDSGGVVTVKDRASAKTRYFAGLYLSQGYLYVKKTDGGWYTGYSTDADDLDGFYGYFKCDEKGRHWYFLNDNTASGLNDTAFTPNGAQYAALLSNEINNATYQSYNIAYYTPRASLPRRVKANGINMNTSVKNAISGNPMGAYRATSSHTTSPRLKMASIPSQPSVSGLQNAQGGEMPKLEITFLFEAWGCGTLAYSYESPTPMKAAEPSGSNKFDDKFATTFSGMSNPSAQTATALFPTVTIKTANGDKHIYDLRPANTWTGTVAKNFDSANTDYWNPRVIPYTWSLPYDQSTWTPAKRVLKTYHEETSPKSLKWGNAKDGDLEVAEKAWEGSDLQDYIKKNVISDRKEGGKLYYDVFGFRRNEDGRTSYPCQLMVFESGALDYEAFLMNQSERQASWSKTTKTEEVLTNPTKKRSILGSIAAGVATAIFTGSIGLGIVAGYLTNISAPGNDSEWQSIPHSGLHGNHNKSIVGEKQWAWRQGGTPSSYDVLWYFFACEDPTNPYGSAAKDLHIVMPQGFGLSWWQDGGNTCQVIGKGRVFLYFTSGDTFYYFGKTSSGTHPWGTVKKDKVDGKYQPQIYLIGAGTNIDFILSGMPLYAYVYMPFGWSTELYGSSGRLKYLNTWNDLAGGSSHYFGSEHYARDNTRATTDVKRNAFTLGLDTGEAKRVILGKFVTDYLYYVPDSDNRLTFKQAAAPDLSDTTIYGQSVIKDGKLKFGTGQKYSLSKFMTLPPGYSTKMLDWKYVSIRVMS